MSTAATWSSADADVEAEGLLWRVRRWPSPDKPPALLIHGTGAAVHSWRTLAPLLAHSFDCIAVDLPGHGGTQTPSRDLFTLSGMARGLDALLAKLMVKPVLVIGHSAGAAVAIRMALDGMLPHGKGLVSLNGALVPFNRPTARLFSPLANLLFNNAAASRLFAWRAATTGSVERLIRNTGSTLDREGVELYREVVSDPKHVAAAIGMMANWDLDPLFAALPNLEMPILLLGASNDRTIPSEQVFTIRERVANGRAYVLRGVGHLAHEERPGETAQHILQFATAIGVSDAS